MAKSSRKSKGAVAYRLLQKQHAKVLAALKKTKLASDKADKEARLLSKLVDEFPMEERELYVEVLKQSIELLETKFVLL